MDGPVIRVATQDERESHESVAEARNGNERAFAALYAAHSGRVYGLALRLTSDPVAARELLQDVFVRAWERLSTFRGESAFGSWLHRLTVNLALTSRRTEVRRLRRVGDEAELPPDGGVATLAKPRSTPVVLLCGALGSGAEAVEASGAFSVVQPIGDRPTTLEAAMEDTARLLANAAARVARGIGIGLDIGQSSGG